MTSTRRQWSAHAVSPGRTTSGGRQAGTRPRPGCRPCAAATVFFSSRRRHTRSWRDWSSGVCSSDLEVVLGEPADGEEPLEDLAEADEHAGADDADHLALERLLPAPLEQDGLEQPREAELVGEVLERGGLALARRRVLGEVRSLPRPDRLVGGSELAEQRTVADEVGVAAD